ncbi:MAG TPA: DUF2235 domain-containing protein [Thermoanaerobaculia bacterium]|nr:DUF2235 domain-containing protein [Thermoanaerobaculia bacterium]
MAKDESVKQRLVLCLDGTWNQQDSGTNIYHLSNLIYEGVAKDGCLQCIYYQQGVGTGVLDSVTGGAFGLGLSSNVREAYDWLVEHYQDDDEIYVFGFSRGAFTARSLVGLIAKCGLLRRGAPIPPDELWHAYQILGRHCNVKTGMDPDPNWWERIAGKPKKPFRELQELRREPWEKSRAIPLQKPANRAEKLLVTWSRRVPIHCIGVFDTVGALGVDALAIPWLRDSTAQFHDASLTSLIVNGFQALAIDEHRASFAHIPWFGDPNAGGTTVNQGHLEQRWFVGAHSNIGGGYEDDVLSQHALAWMMEETGKLGLHFRALGKGGPNPAQPLPCPDCQPLLTPIPSQLGLADQAPTLRDSFSEFAAGIWKNFIRAKREYRRLGPPPKLQEGQVVQSLNETLDRSVEELAQLDPSYRPPNLWRYLKDHSPQHRDLPPPPHRYGEEGWRWWACLAGWLALIALAAWKLGGVLDNRYAPPFGTVSWRWLAVAVPLLALLVDWRESVLNHKTTLYPDGMQAEKRLAWMDWYLGIRLAAITAAAAGLVLLVFQVGWTWLRRDLPLSQPLLWLFAITGLWIYFQAAMAWNGGPFKDAGLGSIVDLQLKRTPKAVQECLLGWAGDDATDAGRQTLMPVVRSLWRDLLGFIPAYTVLLFVGTWLALSLSQNGLPTWDAVGLLSHERSAWLPALLGALLCALADVVEDAGELHYVRRFPELPPPLLVAFTFAATCLKFVLFSVGLLFTGAATLVLAFMQLRGVADQQAGTIGGLGAACALLVASGAVKGLLSRPSGEETKGGQTAKKVRPPKVSLHGAS